ncbi:MAG: hypothetical protein MUO27_01300, partial [Sedimentisphaerales bacterium]|nr:hypothetical protein [Sedimentisphaerales bacterium]
MANTNQTKPAESFVAWVIFSPPFYGGFWLIYSYALTHSRVTSHERQVTISLLHFGIAAKNFS